MIPDYETLYRQYIKGMKQSIGVPNQYVGFCPFHNDKKNRSFSFNTANGLCHCFTGCFKGNAYQFAVEMNHSNPSEWINENIKQPPNHQSVMKPAKTNLFDKAKEYQKNLSVDWINAFSDPFRGKIIFSPDQRGFGGHNPPAVLLIQGSVSCLY